MEGIMGLKRALGEALPDIYDGPPEAINHYHPRLSLDERAFTVTTENSEELRDWAYDAFVNWKRRIDDEQTIPLHARL